MTETGTWGRVVTLTDRLSEVLRVMIATNTDPSTEPKEIAFADGDIALASALRIFLLVLTTNDLLHHLETHPGEFVLGFRGALG